MSENYDGPTLDEVYAERAKDLLGWRTEEYNPPLEPRTNFEKTWEVFTAHRHLREKYGEEFPRPIDIVDNALFITEELGEFGAALRTNTGIYARNNDGEHKAKSNEWKKELADLYLMTLCLHDFHGVDVDMNLLLREWSIIENPKVGNGNLAFLMRLIYNLLDLALSVRKDGEEGTGLIAKKSLPVLAYILRWPEWDVNECFAVIDKWERRAKVRRLQNLAEELDMEVVEVS